MKIDAAAVRQCLKSFDFTTLFREHLGWDNLQTSLSVAVDGHTFSLTAAAHKRNFVAYVCQSIPDRPVRVKIDHQVTKSTKEHFVVYCDQVAGQQVWNWVRREPGRPIASRDHRVDISQSGDRLIQRLEQIAVRLEEEDSTTLLDTTTAVRAAFDVDHVTRRFYDQFKTEHAAFLKFINGIKEQADLEWYTSLMLNRLMFVYFIQKKGFLDSDTDYLRNRLRMVREAKGKDKFQSFYRYFLLRLFHEGLGQSPEERKLDAAMERLLGKVPYLNGGFFEVHQLEERNAGIDIPDKAFEKLFDFFDRWSWHLDERPRRSDHEINPDVVGYIPRWTGENRPLIDTSKPATTGVATETGKFYFVASSGRKSVWTFVRQLRGPHFRTWAWCKRRSRSAVTAAVSLRSLPQSSTGRLDVRSVDARS